MKISITKTEYQKVQKTVEVTVPEQRIFVWHNNIRRAYSVQPIWTHWNVDNYNKPEEIYELKIIMVDPSMKKIEISNLSVRNLPDIITNDKNPYQRLIDDILNYSNDAGYIRTKEQFEADLNYVLNELTN